MNPLAGKPIRYKIGTDNPGPGRLGEILEVSYDIEAPPPVGLAIAYGNLRREDGEPSAYGPYLPHDELWDEYPEGRPDPAGPGFERNVKEQCQRRRRQGFSIIELDNWDSFKIPDVMQALAIAESEKLMVVAKNPGLVLGATQAIAHPIVVGIIVERDAGMPKEMHNLRVAAGKPTLPIWFIAFD